MNAQPNVPTPGPEPESGRAALRVIIVQSVAKDAQTLASFFNRRRDHIWQTTQPGEAMALAPRQKPDLVIVDLHLPGTEWLSLLRLLRQELPATRVIVTNKYPDLSREVLAKEQGVQIFLRQPFSRQWVERALARLSDSNQRDDSPLPAARAGVGPATLLPRVRFPIGLKIALPYVVLAVVFAAGAAYLVTRYVLDTLQERFTNQLVDVGTLSVDWMVQEETRQLDTLRVLANTQGMAEALAAGDAETVRRLAVPVVVNDRQESVGFLDAGGTSLLSMRHPVGGSVEAFDFSRGEAVYRDWPFVQNVLQRRTDATGDKFAGWVPAPWGDYFYVAGPVLDNNGQLVGALVVGISLSSLVREIRAATLAQVSLYDAQGQPLASTLPAEDISLAVPGDLASQVAARASNDSLVRDFAVASARYSEILTPWRARGGVQLGLIGSALTRNYFALPTTLTGLQAFVLVATAFVVIIALGAMLAGRITRPITQMVRASNQIAQGNLEVKVETSGDDEVAVLAHAFNYMITGLQEGFIYRDLLGRTVSPEVRQQLRQSFALGNLKLEGQNVTATVLLSDIRGFTTLSEKEQPTTVLAWLNEYFGGLVPVISSHGGVVDKFEGDAVLAFFGILPRPLSPQESAYQACLAAVAMLKRIDRLNDQRAINGLPPFVTGIGINTGPVTAGGLGTADRLNYTIIGDAVNTAQRLEGFTRDFGTSGIVLSENTAAALEAHWAEFRLELLGTQSLKGKRDEVIVYRLHGLADPVSLPAP
jgi:class 3 adenylate cyclase/CheY-like chemotaxis protein/HAMP domain-containing protein